jgi:hypothetical protein
MTGKVYDLDGGQRAHTPQPPVADFWFAQLDVRLGRIEYMVARLEWQMMIIACVAFVLLALEILQAVRGS